MQSTEGARISSRVEGVVRWKAKNFFEFLALVLLPFTSKTISKRGTDLRITSLGYGRPQEPSPTARPN